METRFPHQEIEKKWQDRWEKEKLYSVTDDGDGENWYELTMYPYPSGDLHVGHWFAMTGADIHARFKSMQGYNVLHPMGFDAFGLNAENAAIARNIHPHTWTMNNIERMRNQLRTLGPMYDWEREVITCIPEYYHWNQWFFLQFYKKGLAYRDNAPVNWCPSCVTVLANEQVINGLCERCDTEVTHRDMNQWFLKITDYAEELLDQSNIDWPERINTMQTNWIGKSEGVEIEFDISEYNLEQASLKTFTTRIDTIYGVTFVVMAPEHPLVPFLTTSKNENEVQAYVTKSRQASEIERLSTEREKTGVFTGSFCINKLTGDKVPILVGDYVLHSYGTGVVMGVPAHDQRDFEFASRYELPIKVVVSPTKWDGEPLKEAFVGRGVQVNSGQFDGLNNSDAMAGITGMIEDRGIGKRQVNYRMRDWLISRQRYWGTPIPIIYCDLCGTVPVPDEELPVILPEDAEFLPTGESPLALHEKFVNTQCPNCKGSATRETDTMDTFVDSSWYFLRYTSPNFKEAAFDPETVNNWNPVDQYTGGVEHAVMHLLYARFFVKAIRDLGLISFHEPFQRLFNQGTIIYKGAKMSKSRGNVIAPDEYVKGVGADVVRTYLMFIGPWDQGGEWNDSGINGAARWLNRVWELAGQDKGGLLQNGSPISDKNLERDTHIAIKKVTGDLDRFKYNTAISSLMEYTNQISEQYREGQVSVNVWANALDNLLILMSPIVPHLTEEMWESLGNSFSIHKQKWPKYDSDLATHDEITLVVQVNGKLRDRIQAPADLEEERAKEIALSSEKVGGYIEGKEINKIIYIEGRLINIVVS
ncbi:MAG: leucine--tRNA ligase [Dehalococcoidia bacterium]